MTNEHKIDVLLGSILYRDIMPASAYNGYHVKTILIVDNDLYDDASEIWDSMFPSKITEYTIINELEYDVFKKHFPKSFKDDRGVECLIPVEEHLMDGSGSPNPYIKMIFPDKEVFRKHIDDEDIIIQGAQFCPVNNEDRIKFTLHDKDVLPIGSLNITVYMVRYNFSYVISNMVCMDLKTGAYEFTNIYKVDNHYMHANLMSWIDMHRCCTPTFVNTTYNLFANVLPTLRYTLIQLWESFQWMMLNPEIKECFFTEDAPLIDPYKKPIKSGVNIKKVRQNVKFIHVDIVKHRDLTRPKRKYTKPDHQVPVKGHIRNRKGNVEYVRPHANYKDKPPIEEPIERKAT